MSHLSFMEKLLDGVDIEWIPLGNFSEIYDGTHQTPKYIDSGVPFVSVQNIKDLSATDKHISAEDFEKYKCKPRTNDLFMTRIGDVGTCAIVSNDEPLAYYVTLALIRSNQNVVNPKYIFHVLHSGIGKSELYKRTLIHAVPMKINLGEIGKLLIPIPCPDNPEKSLEIQAEIVRILDAFTAMTAKLTAELNMRKTQYNYYREKLLSFAGKDVEWKTLGEVTEFSNGKGHEKNISEDGKYIVVNSKFISSDGCIAKYSNSQLCPLFKDDILLVMSDLPNGKALSKTFIVDVDDKYTLNQRIGRLTVKNSKNLLPKFLLYFLNRTPQLLKHDNGVDQTNLRKGQILDVSIPMLPLTEQIHIVNILDKFDALTNSITEGLPREIELRQQQYEYYRDLLLNFPKPEPTPASN